MAATLPYLSSPGTIDTAFKRMKDAATPPRFTNDFVNEVLQIKGGTGSSLPAFFKKLGFLNADATPTAVYDRFRNAATSASAVAQAVRIGYKPLYEVNEYVHKCGDADLKGLILQVTGLEKENRVAQLIYGTLKKLCSHASFEDVAVEPALDHATEPPISTRGTLEIAHAGRSVNLSYTINLNLPPSTNIEVFNAIFKSLREHLLSD